MILPTTSDGILRRFILIAVPCSKTLDFYQTLPVASDGTKIWTFAQEYDSGIEDTTLRWSVS